MNDTQLGIICLLKSAITGEAAALPEGFDAEQAYPILKKHGVRAMGYIGGLNCGISKELPAMQRLRTDYLKALVKSENQIRAVTRLCAAFDSHGIEYMPLKGCNLKPLYPYHELRSMGDADILIRTEQYGAIRPIMEQLGFDEVSESDHELVWNAKSLYLELHKRLIPSESRDYYSYYGDGWKMAKCQNGSRWDMTVEDQFVYIFTHFAKHYRDGGIGCRHVTDLWVYQRSYPALDMDYVRKELETLDLLEFYDNMTRVLAAWFENGQWDTRTEFISRVIFASGLWGDARKHALAQGVKASQAAGGSVGKGKFHRFLEMAFPGREIVGYKYPIVNKWPVLLPFIWVVRAVSTVFTRWGRVKQNYRSLTTVSAMEIQSHAQALEYVGLRFGE